MTCEQGGARTPLSPSTVSVLQAVARERERQTRLWGVQSLKDDTGWMDDVQASSFIKIHNAQLEASGEIAWRHVLGEEVCEAFAECELDKLEEELTQVAAVAVAWIEDIRRRREANKVQP